MKRIPKPKMTKIPKNAIVIEDKLFGDPNCLHCAILNAICKYAEDHNTDGAIDLKEILEGLIHVLIQTVKDDRIPVEEQIGYQDGILRLLETQGIHWMRIEGAKQ